MKERARGYRRHVEGGHQLLNGLFARIDDAEDRSPLSGQGCCGDDLGRTQRAGRGGRVVVSVTLVEPYLVANTDGQGFVVSEDDCVGNTRKGKQVMNVEMPVEACAIATVAGDTVAVIGTNHKMVLFPLEQVPEMALAAQARE